MNYDEETTLRDAPGASSSADKPPGLWARQAFDDCERSMRETVEANLPPLRTLGARLRRDEYSNVVVTGEGSSYEAGLMCEGALARWAGLRCSVSLSTEVGYLEDHVTEKTCVVVLSRTGERRYVLDAMAALRERCGRMVAITGNRDASMCQLADEVLFTEEGSEPAFLKSKSTLAGTAVLLALAAVLDETSDSVLEERRRLLVALAETVGGAFKASASLADLVLGTKEMPDHWVMLAAGPSFGAMADGSVKFHEITTVPAMPYRLSNLYHGPLGQLGASWGAFVASTGRSRYWADLVSSELVNRGASTIVYLNATRQPAPGDVFPVALPVRPLEARCSDDALLEELLPAVFLPPIYVLALEAAVRSGIDPDAPPNMDYMLKLLLPPGKVEPDLVHLQR
jgi:glutamine---fructose-6-phosphate transaminase (isomerizing)